MAMLWRYRAALMVAGVAALAGIMRFVGLGYPPTLVFDETYYAKGAYSLWRLGFEGDWDPDLGNFSLGDDSGLATGTADYVVHPLTGKWLIAMGIELFGPTPFGWRFSAALFGTVTVVLVALIARHLFQSTVWGAIAGVFLAVDGQHVVMSRTALLDIFLTFFAVVGFGLLLVDRRRTRAKLAAQAATADGIVPGIGPRLGVRWWRFAAVVAFGLGVSVKWSGLYFAAAFLVLSVVWDAADRREFGFRRWFAGSALRAVPAALMTLLVLPAVYVATWWSWFTADAAWGRDWAENHPGEGVTWLPNALNSLVNYHVDMWQFHSTLTADHPYAAHPLGWIIQLRPTAFHFQDVTVVGCGADRCVSSITALGHPFIWWAGAAALVFALWRVARKADLLALTVITGTLAAWLPWIPFAHRTIFTFYSVAMAPFVVLTLVWALRHAALGEGVERWNRSSAAMVAVFVGVVLIFAGFFIPIWTGQPIPYWYWQSHMWLPSWI